MKESIAEYSRIVILALCFVFLCYFILGGNWFGKLGITAGQLQNEVVEDSQNDFLNAIDNRTPPVLIVQNKTFKTGVPVYLMSLVPEKDGELYAVRDADGNNIRENVAIEFTHKDYDIKNKIFTPQQEGSYTIKYSVSDAFGLSTTKSITLLISNSVEGDGFSNQNAEYRPNDPDKSIDDVKEGFLDPGDGVSYGDYDYTYVEIGDLYGWQATVKKESKNKSVLTEMETVLLDAPVISVDNCFEGCSNLTVSPIIPATVISMNETFLECYRLKGFPEIPNGVRRMTRTFADCYEIDGEIILPEGISVLEGTFYNCSNLSKLPEIPNGVTDLISTFVSVSPTNIDSWIMPDTVMVMKYVFMGSSIDKLPKLHNGIVNMDGCFEACFNLTDISSTTIPSSVTSMRYTFYYCNNITKTPKFSEGILDMTGAFASCGKLISHDSIPFSVNNLDGSFVGCNALAVANIPCRFYDWYRYSEIEYDIVSSEYTTINWIHNTSDECRHIPEGGEYYDVSARTTYYAWDKFPNFEEGDVYSYGDYDYTYTTATGYAVRRSYAIPTGYFVGVPKNKSVSASNSAGTPIADVWNAPVNFISGFDLTCYAFSSYNVKYNDGTTETVAEISRDQIIKGIQSATFGFTVKDKSHSDHTYVDNGSYSATCTATGMTKKKCSNCSTLNNTTLAALGHSHTSKTTTSAYLKSSATCTSAATYYYKCSRCSSKGSSTYTSGSANGHSPYTSSYSYYRHNSYCYVQRSNIKCYNCSSYSDSSDTNVGHTWDSNGYKTLSNGSTIKGYPYNGSSGASFATHKAVMSNMWSIKVNDKYVTSFSSYGGESGHRGSLFSSSSLSSSYSTGILSYGSGYTKVKQCGRNHTINGTTYSCRMIGSVAK